MAGNGTDRRIAKTRQALAKSLHELMQKHHWNDITIQAVCDGANVARSSFYAHFDTLISLLDAMIAANLPKFVPTTGDLTRIETIDWTIDHITSNRRLFSHTVNTASGNTVLLRFKNGIKAILNEEMRTKGLDVSDTRLAFLIGGTFEAIQTWAVQWRMDQIVALKQEVGAIAQSIILR